MSIITRIAKGSFFVFAIAIFTTLILAIFQPEYLRRILFTPERLSNQILINQDQQTKFPDIDTTKFSIRQLQLLRTLQDEYSKNPKSFDSSVLTYSENNQESWCADFVSFAYHQSGFDFKNPHSGSWRIPGVYTLEEYLQSNNYWHDNDYQPSFGDIVTYDGTHSPFGQHTNIVLSNNNGILTTIGGNENHKIMIRAFKLTTEVAVRGFGHIPLD